MGRRWIIIIILIILTASFIIWGHVKSSVAQPDKFYYLKILEKVDVVLKNQDSILKELKAMKRLIAEE